MFLEQRRDCRARGARIGSDQMLCNGPLRLALLLTTTLCLFGCKKDASDMEGADGGAGDGGAASALDTADAEVIPPLPISPLDLFRHFPAAPKGIAAVPGDGMEVLSEIRDRLRDSYYSPRVLVEQPQEGPFRMIHYQLSEDGSEVKAVLATFTSAYGYKDRRGSLEEAITLRIGKGKPFKSKQYKGTRWNIMDFRVDLRTDPKSPYVELLLHRRGNIDPTAKKKRR